MKHSPLEAVYIFFDTATYDEIERDEKVMLETDCLCFFSSKDISKNLTFLKVTIEAQLGLIGGTMGLLTGFSILSGVEIVYFLIRFLLNFFDNFSFARFLLSLKIRRVFCRELEIQKPSAWKELSIKSSVEQKEMWIIYLSLCDTTCNCKMSNLIYDIDNSCAVGSNGSLSFLWRE